MIRQTLTTILAMACITGMASPQAHPFDQPPSGGRVVAVHDVHRDSHHATYPRHRTQRIGGHGSRDRAVAGAVIGGIVGAIAGNQVANREARGLFTLGGGLLGAVIGHELGRKLEKRADRDHRPQRRPIRRHQRLVEKGVEYEQRRRRDGVWHGAPPHRDRTTLHAPRTLRF